MNRRRFLASSASFGAGVLIAHNVQRVLAAPATPAAGEFPAFEIAVTDTGFQVPATLAAGRYAVTVTNSGTQPVHASMGWVPGDITNDMLKVATDADPNNDGEMTTPKFFTIQFVGLPDWPAPGASRTGIVDLPRTGRYLVVDPISSRAISIVQVTGEAATAPDPVSVATVTLQEMSISFPETAMPGKGLWRIENKGAFSHEMALFAVPAGTTDEAWGQYLAWGFSMPPDATPDPAATPPGGLPVEILASYAPVAAMSILHPGGVAWLDIDLPAGTYGALCAVPGPTDDIPPHAMMGMHAVFTVV